jgi:exosortase B
MQPMPNPDISPLSPGLRTLAATSGPFDRRAIAALALIAGAAVLFLPSYYELARTTWGEDSQGHMPMILALSLWLIFRERSAIFAMPERPAYVSGFVLLTCGLLLYVLGRSQAMIGLEISAQLPIFAAMLLLFRGWAGLGKVWFPILFLLFTVPLPGVFTQALTVPLKLAVSAAADGVLYHLGYPIARTGVMITIGPYQLMVADACSGLSSIFTLEALGLLYMKLMDYKSGARNAFVAVMVVPISFVANVTRVIVLVLVTYYLGDEVGQGFLHGAAGMLLFMVGLSMLLTLDALISRFEKWKVRNERQPV